jgi:DNA-binding FadR family transcriptional regulator
MLAPRLGVSRAALRVAFERLEAEGQVWRHVGRGTFIGNRPTDAAEDFAAVSRITNPSELIEIRKLTEPSFASVAAIRASAADIAHMTKCLSKLEQALQRLEDDRGSLYDKWDQTLHRAIAEANHNSVTLAVFDTISTIRKMAQWGDLLSASIPPQRWRLYCQQHRRIVEAITNRDSLGASQAMADHLRTVEENQFRKLENFVHVSKTIRK